MNTKSAAFILQTPFWQHSAPVAVKLPSLTSPLAIINHVTRRMKSSGSAAIGGHPCIYMTIQRDLPASRCVSQTLGLCLYDFTAWWRYAGDYSQVQHIQYATLVSRWFRWCQTIDFFFLINHLFYDIVYPSSFRWLPSTKSSSDGSRPGSCVCVSLCRAGPRHQWSQRSVYFSMSLQHHCHQRKEKIRYTSVLSLTAVIHTVSYEYITASGWQIVISIKTPDLRMSAAKQHTSQKSCGTRNPYLVMLSSDLIM